MSDPALSDSELFEASFADPALGDAFLADEPPPDPGHPFASCPCPHCGTIVPGARIRGPGVVMPCPRTDCGRPVAYRGGVLVPIDDLLRRAAFPPDPPGTDDR